MLLLSRGGDISGEQRQLLYLIRGLDRGRYTPIVLSTRGGQFQSELRTLGVEHYIRPLAGWRKGKCLLHRYRDAAYVKALARSEGVSLVHCSDVWLSEYALRAARGANIPAVLHVRAPLSRRQAWKLRCHRATRVVVISNRVRMRLGQTKCVPPDRMVLIHDAVDAEAFVPLPAGTDGNVLHASYGTAGKVLVGIVGRVQPAKDQLSFVRIAEAVLTKTNRAAFFIIGEAKDKSYAAKITQYLQDHGLSEHIHFTGRRNDIAPVLASLDILVSLSGGSVRYEAMMCGLAVVCAWSRSEEESHHIRHGETGFLVTETDNSALTDTLLEVIEDDTRRRCVGDNARTWAQQHLSHAQLVRDTQALYDQLLHNAAQQPVNRWS